MVEAIVRLNMLTNYRFDHGEGRIEGENYNNIYEPHCPHLYNRLSYCRGAHIWCTTRLAPNLYKCQGS
jgi:hypothetical protein